MNSEDFGSDFFFKFFKKKIHFFKNPFLDERTPDDQDLKERTRKPGRTKPNDQDLKKKELTYGNLDVDEVINDQDLKKERTMETWTNEVVKTLTTRI
ncbi:unnamed protein product [Rhizophagus irregularis]|nr:unnamed protein product [Rhizophagus irregularis]